MESKGYRAYPDEKFETNGYGYILLMKDGDPTIYGVKIERTIVAMDYERVNKKNKEIE